LQPDNKHEFSESLIKSYLDAEIYLKRGLTREEYIKLCKDKWDNTEIDPLVERKIIIDFLHPVTLKEFFGIDESGFDFTEFLDVPVNGMDKLGKDIECIKMFFGHEPKDGKVEKINYNKLFDADTEKHFEDSLSPSNYLIGVFDVLGFSDLVMQLGSDGVMDNYQKLINLTLLDKNYKSFERIKSGDNQYIFGALNVPIKYSYFSDTIIFWTPGIKSSVSPFIAKCADLLCEALKLNMPLRGAISFGEAVMSKTNNTYVGQAFVEAAKIESSQKWIGVSFGSNFSLPENRSEIYEELLVPLYTKHYKNIVQCPRPYLALDWVTRWKKKGYGNLEDILVKMQESSPKAVKEYYQNTIDFIKFTERHQNKFRWRFLQSDFIRSPKFSELYYHDIHQLTHQIIFGRQDNGDFFSGLWITFPKETLKGTWFFKRHYNKNLLYLPFDAYDYFDEDSKAKTLQYTMFKKNQPLKAIPYKNIDYIDILSYDKTKIKMPHNHMQHDNETNF
jgi:hypothetical protein